MAYSYVTRVLDYRSNPIGFYDTITKLNVERRGGGGYHLIPLTSNGGQAANLAFETYGGYSFYNSNYNYRLKVVYSRTGNTTDTSTAYVYFTPSNTETLLGSTGINIPSDAGGRFISAELEHELKDSAPTTPPTITVGGALNSGNSVSVSWGASTDPDGDPITYQPKVSLNQQSWVDIGSRTTNRTVLYTIPNGTTNIRFRVQAYANGVWSGSKDTNTMPVNNPPSTPGAFTNPTGDLEIGDAKTISWGASTDPDGGTLTYELGVSINGGSYTVLGEASSPSYNYTIPTATSLKFRVRTQDSGGLWSSYRESALFTVTKPKYYYSKYNTILEWENPESKSWIFHNNYIPDGSQWWSSWVWNKNSGFSGAGNGPYIISSSQQAIGTFMAQNNGIKNGYQQQELLNIYSATSSRVNNNGWSGTINKIVINKNVAVRGSLNQSGIIAEDGTYPTDGRHSDGYWYVRGSRVNESIAPPTPFTSPASGTVFRPGDVSTITWGATTAPNLSVYELDYQFNQDGEWIATGRNTLVSRTQNITSDKTKTSIQYRVRAKNTSNVYSDYVYSEVYTIQHNLAPTLVLNTEDGKTLYENDSFIIDGSTIDSDPDQSVTVYYQINDEPRKVLTTNLSKVTIPFNKQLLFKSGKLLDGETAITGELTDGVAHTLKVWSQDSDGAESIPEIRLFYVVPNRAPTLVINDFTTEGTIDSDKFTIAGTAGDPDANSNVKVTYRINANNSVEVYNGPGGDFNFEVYFKDLKIGSNSIIVEAIDNYGAKYSKTIKLDKSEVSTPLLKSTARYKVQPPNGSAKGLLLWVRRSINLDVDVKISMTLTGEQESFVAMTLENTANITTDTVEDEFFYEVLEPKDNIILQLDLTRSSVDVDDSITLISGVLE